MSMSIDICTNDKYKHCVESLDISYNFDWMLDFWDISIYQIYDKTPREAYYICKNFLRILTENPQKEPANDISRCFVYEDAIIFLKRLISFFDKYKYNKSKRYIIKIF